MIGFLILVLEKFGYNWKRFVHDLMVHGVKRVPNWNVIRGDNVRVVISTTILRQDIAE